ncbi:hypothetical protein T484DRAFT_1832620 [Baffinella frigidus]|nr:hypothetical protein T484DRAFT_1832620 [Cryptophyta sp. CCMP2293]
MQLLGGGGLKQRLQQFQHLQNQPQLQLQQQQPFQGKDAKKLGAKLCEAAFSGDLATIQKMVKNNASVDHSDYDKRSMLHLACAEGHVNVVGGRMGGEPLQDSMRGHHTQTTKLLQQHIARVDEEAKRLGSELCEAAFSGDLATIQEAEMDPSACPKAASSASRSSAFAHSSRSAQREGASDGGSPSSGVAGGDAAGGAGGGYSQLLPQLQKLHQLQRHLQQQQQHLRQQQHYAQRHEQQLHQAGIDTGANLFQQQLHLQSLQQQGGNQEIEAFFSEEEAEEDQRSHPALGSKRGLAPSMLEDEDYEGSDLDALSRESKRARSRYKVVGIPFGEWEEAPGSLERTQGAVAFVRRELGLSPRL